VSIPLHKNVLGIMAKYEGKTANSLPPALSNQKMNDYLKEIGKLVDSLKEATTERRITKGGVKLITQAKKCERLTTHTARRSFATNLYLDKMPAYTIMQITGHKSERSFFAYIKITPEESADVIANHWQQKESVLKIA
jgi:integrase